MKIFVHESITGGGVPSSLIVSSLLAEGRMMIEALLADFLRLEAHEVLSLVDPRRVKPLPPHPRLRVVDGLRDHRRAFAEMVEEAEAVFLLAPETAGVLEELTAFVEATGKLVLGSNSAGIRAAGDKVLTHELLKAGGVPTPETHRVRRPVDLGPLARHLGYPVVVKPHDGVGCQSVFVAGREAELLRAYATAGREAGFERLIVQPYIEGVHASVSLVTDGTSCLPLTLNFQEIAGHARLRYRGGRVPLDHPFRSKAFRRAEQTVRAIPGLKGYIGIDVVLTARDVVVIEVNPRVTTSYVGIRRILRQNPAALILDAVGGRLPDRRRITMSGTATFTTRTSEVVAPGRTQWST